MKETKTYCDICKEEVPPHVHQKVVLSGFTSSVSGCCNVVELEVCRPCGVKFFNLLYEMQNSALLKCLGCQYCRLP